MAVIAIDLDDVLAEFHRGFIEYLNQTLNKNFTFNDLCHPEISRIIGISQDKLLEHATRFDATEAKTNLVPLPGSIEMVYRLAQTHELHIVTNRPMEIAESTCEWLSQHFPEKFEGFHFCTKNFGTQKRISKNDVCRNIGANIIIEDHPHNAMTCAADGIHVYLISQPWNQQEFPLFPGAIIRVNGWEDPIMETIMHTR